MSKGYRPGGLTALACVNFLFGGLSLIGSFLFLLLLAALLALSPEKVQEGLTEEQLELVGAPILVTMIVFSFLTASLAIFSAIGYLQQKRFLGRTLGNVYALTGIAYSISKATAISPDAGGGFGLGSIAGLVYPLLTLLLLNTTFKKDLVR